MSSTSWIRRILSGSGAMAFVLVLSPAGLANYGESYRTGSLWAFTPPGSDGIRRPNGPTIPGTSRVFTPRDDIRRPSEDHTGGSVRGCGDDIVAIAPRLNAIGQTASINPTFVWYNFSPDNDPVEFQLYRLNPDNAPERILTEQFDTSQQGYESYTLPTDKATLTAGETYIWQIVLYCDAAFTNPGHYSSAELDVVTLPAEVATTDDALTNAQAYANEGLWYDALAEAYDANTPATEKFRQDLLLDLADIEAQSDKDEAADLSEQLREIAGPE
ncbi:DUF928 domain-containing protein [Adonisia turfae]|uniref:DUF928 domain-containing protein n=1 Tax=Adonisia turfae CCMR0081 TaxID=2292702 RepID=A0A6M0RQB8_9CYAN|nr:DUF928 domain-containing protein [Adonisia turfae]NEZ58458.1 DUF928 domain-containing protein [Adonisia turfae CCMR0081]